MASPIAIIPLLCIALRGPRPAANKQQGHSCLWKAVIIPKATPLLCLSSPAGSTGSCGAVPLHWQLRRWESGHRQQCSVWCTNPHPNNPARRPPAALGGLKMEKHPPFSFPSMVFLNQHTTSNIMVPCQTTEKHQNLSISTFTGDTKGHCTGTEARRSLGNLLHSNLSENKYCREWRIFFFVLTSVQESIACNRVYGHAGLGSKSRTHLWLLTLCTPAQRGSWKSSNVNSDPGCPNKHSLAMTEAYQKADWHSCLRSRETPWWKPSDKEYFYPSITKEGQKDAMDSNFSLFLESNLTNAWDKIYLGPSSTITKILGPHCTRDREILKGSLSPQLYCSYNLVSGVHYCPSQGQGTKLDGPQWDKMSNISGS